MTPRGCCTGVWRPGGCNKAATSSAELGRKTGARANNAEDERRRRRRRHCALISDEVLANVEIVRYIDKRNSAFW
jgi:hypothetical protein